ncbi:TPA: hypothetical protein PPE65_004181 [Escherichia coli]|nr:hypothetical protein [Escherichia coli]
MIKKASLLTACSVTAFSAWAQDTSPDTLVVTANRFEQPRSTVLAPTTVVYSAAIFLIPICISFDTAEKRRYATYLILNRRFSFAF